ncbi:unnamed protein product, partial [Gongylonema pulchrum]|uniref:C2 domain-containing protein n=1 Tax=Gongylonema pulchrum TaxID=637853 RepID=A0A183D9E0_9BILA
VCVRVRLTQGDVAQTKQSRVIKSTCNAVYKEAIMFLVKTKSADLQDTGIIISLAMDKSEQEQWKNTVENTGKEFKGVHHLKAPAQAPDVHVTEAPSDSE